MANSIDRMNFIENFQKYSLALYKTCSLEEKDIILKDIRELIPTIDLFITLYNHSQNPDNTKVSCEYYKAINEHLYDIYLLPSGIYGTPLALALEMQLFDIALDIILRLPCDQIDTTIIAYNDKEQFTIEDIYNANKNDFYECMVFPDIESNLAYQRKTKGYKTLRKILQNENQE